MTVTLADVAADHKRLRDLLERIEANPEISPQVAVELSAALAEHQQAFTQAVLMFGGADDPKQGLDRRLLISATRGVDHLAVRLQSPCRGADTQDRLIVALRELLHEHERLEWELAVAHLDGPHNGATGADPAVGESRGSRTPGASIRRSARRQPVANEAS
jgi:hypothetical protein